MTQTVDFPLHAEVHSRGFPDEASGGIGKYLRNAGAQQFVHAHGRTLYDHLIGTQEILRRWLQPRWLQDAGAMHSVYSTDVYRKQLVRLSKRDEVRAVVGERAERLAYLFCVLSRDSFFDAVDANERLAEDGITVKPASGREPLEWLSCHEASHLLLLHMANLAEQSRSPLGEPGRWLARVSRLGAKLDDTQTLIPPAFGSFTAIVTPQQEDRARECYLAGLAATDFREAALQLSTASKSCPWIAEPLVACAYLALRAGNLAEARLWIADARRMLIDLGAAWDPRLEYGDWLKLISLIEDLAFGRSKAASALPSFDLVAAGDFPGALERAIGADVRASASAFDSERNSGVERFHRYMDSLSRNGAGRKSRHYPGLSSKPWYDASAFALANDLTAHYHEIRSEILQLQGEGFHRESERIRRRGAWDVLMLYERGRKKTENCDRCPVTTRVVEAHNTVRTHAGLIYFSRMKPGTHIAAHRGPTNIRLRCHLGIQVPKGDCGLRVGDETRGWSEGECIVFDDYFEHEAWNHTPHARIVLIVDIWHPDLSPAEVRLLEGLHGYAFNVTQSLTRYWAANAQAAREYD
jgi:aspartyl/asparaginyl beta-hydroxylase (cupin superfamily)